MGILDDVFVNAKSAADIFSKKAGDIYDISKLKLSEANLKSELNRKYQSYGKAVYNKENSETIKALEKEIAELIESISDISKLYNSMKNSKVCNTCGEHMSKEAHFCPVCGSEQSAEERVCPVCSKIVDRDSFYCLHCGAKINKD